VQPWGHRHLPKKSSYINALRRGPKRGAIAPIARPAELAGHEPEKNYGNAGGEQPR
jgi:hypothetical protein